MSFSHFLLKTQEMSLKTVKAVIATNPSCKFCHRGTNNFNKKLCTLQIKSYKDIVMIITMTTATKRVS
jgi:hypothetical protein